MMTTILLAIIAVVGLAAGSFINVVVLRLHAGKNFTKGRSHCPKCNHTLSVLELIPVVSWVALSGRCRNCGKGISVQYPIVELVTAIVFVLAYTSHPFTTYGDLITLVLWFYILGSLMVLAVYDLRWYLLPDKVLLPILIPAAAVLFSEVLLTRHLQVVIGPVLAAVLFAGAFYSLAAVSRGRWMGGGDIKLAFVMGLLLGLQRTTVAMLFGFVSAAIIGVALMVLGRKSRRDMIPFGPFLIAGTFVAYCFGSQLITWYFTLGT